MIRSASHLAALGVFAVAGAYQLLALAASLRQWRRQRRSPLPSDSLPGVSILKPTGGIDASFEAALRTHAAIRYAGRWEVLVGVRDPASPAYAIVGRVLADFPEVNLRVIHCPTPAPNAKVGTLEDLARAAQYPVLVVNDADIEAPPDYLMRLAPRLAEDASLGLLTCLYRARASGAASALEALGIATDFAPSAMVAPLVGVREFGLGSTLAFRAETLERIGGFAAIRDYIADDYQLGKRISSLGLRVELADFPVATHVDGDWAAVWEHQVRWARTIRLSRGAYLGVPVTNATVWACALAGVFGEWTLAGVLMALRLATGIVAGAGVLRDPLTLRLWWLMPVRDWFGLLVWCAGVAGREVAWRGRRLQLSADGRIHAPEP